ncbi:cobalamin-dependent protein [Rhizobium sp. RU20A]|uniref:cobalamin B12-binding domain-containing protein n=1 Tax=Rhizobium sp. RU20A TaxID=1907412 RepID=UPI001FCE7876|nr:cobalamin-dependent protein [Rhizobium sp. RU20A]
MSDDAGPPKPRGRSDAAKTPEGADGEVHLSASDHRLLERTIRGSVPGIVGAGHPELIHGHAGDAMAGEHSMQHPELHPLARQMPGTDQAVAFRPRLLACLIDADPRHHRGFLEELQRSGVPVRTLAVHLFAPVAASLGDLWCTDEADLMQVAVASTRLSMIVNHISHASIAPQVEGARRKSILLARTPGGLHTIGLSIVASCFRDMGWGVEGGGDLEIDDSLYTRLSRKPYTVLGISVGRVDEVPACTDVIRRVQTTPATRTMRIAVGGPAVIAKPRAFQGIGADFVTRSALEVVQMASSA